MILDELLDGCVLLPNDKNKMLNRGFSEDDIEKKRWKSCQPNNTRLISSLLDKYGVDECLRAGIIEQSSLDPKSWQPTKQLLDYNILIPYLRKDGTVEKLRPHKLGFANQPALVYQPASAYEVSSCCIIAEGEFKADAAEKFGYAAIAVPGINSMSGKNWEYFYGVLKQIKTKEFIIMFDTEIKNDPKLPKFKADWRKRYDTIIYAYAMCQKILNVGINCRVAMLPYEWMENGKIDIDLALAQKRNIHEFKDVVDKATGPQGFLNISPIPEEHRSYVMRRVRKFFSQSIVNAVNNCFYVNKKESDKKKISNCIIRIKNIYEELGSETPGVKRDVIITDEYGFVTRPINMVAPNMATKGAVTTWLMSQGNYLFFGDDKDVISMWEYIFDNDEGDLVYLINKCGYIKEYDFWLFKNVLIKQGKIHTPDENGVFWLDQVGFKPNRISDDEEVPSLTLEGNFDISQFLSYLADTVDGMKGGLAKALFAWLIAIIFLEPIYKKFSMFPIMFLYGSRGSGKTTIMRWLTSFFGLEHISKSLAASSPVGITRLLSYYANLPLIVDDWRDDPKSTSFTTLFLGVYNRQVGAKGVKAKFGLQQTDIRAALAIMGEELISDNGLFTRCVSFYIPPNRRKERFEDMEKIIPEASKFITDLLVNKFELYKDKILTNISIAIDKIKTNVPGIEQRLAFNYGILLGSYTTVLGEDRDLDNYIEMKVKSTQRESTHGDKIHKFAEEFMFGHSQGIIHGTHFKYFGDDIIFIWVKGVCDILNKYYNRHVDQAKILTKHFEQQKYYMCEKKMKLSGMLGVVTCVQLNLNKMPDDLKDFFSCGKA